MVFSASAAPKVEGNLITGTHSNVVTLSLSNNNIEYFRTEYRRNNATNTESYVLAKDYAVDDHEIVSMQLVKGEDGKSYASVRDARTLRNNITMVLDVRVEEGKKATLYYTVSSQF